MKESVESIESTCTIMMNTSMMTNLGKIEMLNRHPGIDEQK